MPSPTHIVISHPSQHTEGLFRASDGMYLGDCQKCMVVFGENPNKRESRIFLDHESAQRFLREEVTGNDEKGRGLKDNGLTLNPVLVEDRNQEAESKIILLPDSQDMIVNGAMPGVRAFKN